MKTRVLALSLCSLACSGEPFTAAERAALAVEPPGGDADSGALGGSGAAGAAGAEVGGSGGAGASGGSAGATVGGAAGSAGPSPWLTAACSAGEGAGPLPGECEGLWSVSLDGVHGVQCILTTCSFLCSSEYMPPGLCDALGGRCEIPNDNWAQAPFCLP